MVDTVQSEQSGGQLVDNQLAIQKSSIAIEQALSQAGVQGGAGVAAAAAGGSRSDVADVLESTAMKSVTAKAGPVGSIFMTTMTDLSDGAKRSSPNALLEGGGGNKRERAIQSKYAGSDGFMPSGGYGERLAIAKDIRRGGGGNKKEQADRKLADKITGMTSSAAGHSYAHGNSVVMVAGGKVSGSSIAALSATPGIVAESVHKHIENINTAKQNMDKPTWARINQGAAMGHADAEQLINQETPEQQRMRMGQASQSYRQMISEEQHDFSAVRGPSAPKPPGERK